MNIEFIIQNLKCGGCSNQITNKLSQIEGVNEVEVNVAQNSVSFNYASENELIKVVNALKQMGYPLIEQANTMLDKTKSYVSCMIGRTKSK